MVGVDGETDMSEDQETEQSADLEVVIGKEGLVVYGPALPTRADLAAAAREERDTQLRVYIIFAHRWKCNVIVYEINELYIRISPQYVHIFFSL
jgi:predicted HNH restriction endonuclease